MQCQVGAEVSLRGMLRRASLWFCGAGHANGRKVLRETRVKGMGCPCYPDGGWKSNKGGRGHVRSGGLQLLAHGPPSVV